MAISKNVLRDQKAIGRLRFIRVRDARWLRRWVWERPP